MTIYTLFVCVGFYIFFHKECKSSNYLLLLCFVVRIISLLYYVNTSTHYSGLSDDFVYYSVGQNLLRDTPYELLFHDLGIAYFLSMGQHILYGIINFLIYYYFGVNIFYMLLYNFVILLISLAFAKRLVTKITGDYNLSVLFCCLYLIYPDFIAISILNLKDFTVLLLYIVLNYATVCILINWNRSYFRSLINIVLVFCSLFLLFFIRFYLIYLYFLSLGVFVIIKVRLLSLKSFITVSILLALIKAKGLYDFMISPFFLSVSNDYFFYKLPAFLNWTLIFPLVLYGFKKSFDLRNLTWPIVFLGVIFLFYALFGADAGLVGPRQRLFIEPFYVFFLSCGLYFIYKEKQVKIFGISIVYTNK